MSSSATSEGNSSSHVVTRSTPQGLRTPLIPRRTREKPSHIPLPTTTAIRFIGSISSSPSPFPHYALSSMLTQLPPLITMFIIARSQGLSPHCLNFFSFLDGTPRPNKSSRAGPVPTSLLILLQPARLSFPTSATISVII